MPEGTRLHLDVTLELGGDTISGTIDDGAGPGVEFAGWLELMSAFDTVSTRAGGRCAADPGATPGPGRPAQEP